MIVYLRSFLVSVAAIAVVGSGLEAQAQTLDTGSTNALPSKPAVAESSLPAPVPGTTATSAATLTPESSLTPQAADTASQTNPPKVAQSNIDIEQSRATPVASSYIGVGANIGLDGNSALGDANFTVFSKIGITNAISLRPSAVIGSDAVFLIPVTYDFSFGQIDTFNEPLPIAPFAGAGVAISTGRNSNVGPMLTAGVDYPLTPQFTATAAVNVGFLDRTDVGLLLGVGYNFAGLRF